MKRWSLFMMFFCMLSIIGIGKTADVKVAYDEGGKPMGMTVAYDEGGGGMSAPKSVYLASIAKYNADWGDPMSTKA